MRFAVQRSPALHTHRLHRAPAPATRRVTCIMAAADSAATAQLSTRGAAAIKPGLSYFRAFAALQSRPWSKDDPEGNIIVVVAENKLTSDVVNERLQRCSPPTENTLFYPKDWSGDERLRKALAALMERTWFQGNAVNHTNLVVLAGAGAIIENLFWCIGEAGQCVLIPRPYYPAFDNDLQVKCGMIAVPFDLDETKGDIAKQLADAAAAAKAQHGSGVKAVLLTNPNNPLSTMYRRDTLVEVLRWSMQHEVHVVSDEIYALSVWGEGAPRMVSMEVIAREEAASLPGGDARAAQLLHIVFGLSKDFCASGLRMGCLHTRNALLTRALSNLGYFCLCSRHTQQLAAELLEDSEWVDGFVAENNRRMKHSYDLLSGALREAGIPFIQGNSAMFCWIDLRSGLLPSKAAAAGGDGGADWAAEEELWEELWQKHGVLLTPGSTCHATEPGWFRMCWAWVPGEALPVAVRRIRAVLDARKQQQQ